MKSLLWLTEFLAGNFYLVCDSCAATGGKFKLAFPRMQSQDERNYNILSDITNMNQSMKELDSKITGMLSCMDSFRDKFNKAASL